MIGDEGLTQFGYVLSVLVMLMSIRISIHVAGKRIADAIDRQTEELKEK